VDARFRAVVAVGDARSIRGRARSVIACSITRRYINSGLERLLKRSISTLRCLSLIR
jgi:hypothetical protein